MLLSVIEQGMFSLISLTTVVYLARKTTIEELAAYNDIVIILTFGLMLCTSSSVTPLNSLRSAIHPQTLNLISTINTLIVASVCGFLLAAYLWTNKSSPGAPVAAAALFAFFSITRDFARKKLFTDENKIGIPVAISYAMFFFAILLIGSKSLGTALSAAIAPASLYLAYLVYGLRQAINSRTKITWEDIRIYYKFSGFQSASAIMLWLSINTYLIYSSHHLPNLDNATLRAALSLGSIIGIMILSAENIVSKSSTQLKEITKKKIIQSSIKLAGAAATITAVTGYFSAKIFHIAFGSTYLEDGPKLLTLVVLWQSISLLNFFYQAILRSKNLTQIITASYIAMLFTSFALYAALIDRMGAIGAIAGLIIGQTATTGISLIGATYHARKNCNNLS